jgi:hypothetical protein
MEQAANAQTPLPADADTANVPANVPLSSFIFDGWFVSGTPTLNGAVNPADSTEVTNAPNWAFYQWGENMFLWLTSPSPSIYGGNGLVLTSPIFYNVSPPDANGNRTVTQNAIRDRFIDMIVRKAQVGPEALPIVRDKFGNVYNVEPLMLGPTGKPLMVDSLGRSVEIQRVKIGRSGELTLLDRSGKTIEPRLGKGREPVLFGRQGKPLKIVRIVPGFNGSFIFLDQFDSAIQFGEGQSDPGSSVLMAQNGSLVYFTIFVNDEYAYFLTGNSHGAFSPAITTFPTTAAQMQQISSYAQANGHTLAAPNTLAMEVKTAWIETTGLDASQYVTINATIPTYKTITPANPNNPASLVPNGTKQAQLALVGIHIVGSAGDIAGNFPGMIWATFEHVNNTPDATYSYTATAPSGSTTPTVVKTVPQSTAGKWLFCSSGSTGPFNQPRLSEQAGGTIVAQNGNTIAPSDTLRVMAWGGPSDVSPNPVDPSAADSNSEIIALNNLAHQQLIAGDVRANYILIGATFSGTGPQLGPLQGDVPGPNSVPWPDVPNPPKTDIIDELGTSQLANSTLETYSQPAVTTYNPLNNCFLCHQGNALGTHAGLGLSHIYGQIKPLF